MLLWKYLWLWFKSNTKMPNETGIEFHGSVDALYVIFTVVSQDCPTLLSNDMRWEIEEILYQCKKGKMETMDPYFDNAFTPLDVQLSVELSLCFDIWAYLCVLSLIIFCGAMKWMYLLHSRGEMARLRLTAALCILKIVHVGAYAEIVTNETFQNLALIINVSQVTLY